MLNGNSTFVDAQRRAIAITNDYCYSSNFHHYDGLHTGILDAYVDVHSITYRGICNNIDICPLDGIICYDCAALHYVAYDVTFDYDFNYYNPINLD